MKILLFGSRDISYIPSTVAAQLEQLMNHGKGTVEFIVGDNAGIDSAFHYTLSKIGARSKTTIYGIDYIKNNKFDFNTRIFKSEDYEYEDDMYKFKDRQMADDCDIAIVLWDGKSKSVMNRIMLLNMRNKKVYQFNLG